MPPKCTLSMSIHSLTWLATYSECKHCTIERSAWGVRINLAHTPTLSSGLMFLDDRSPAYSVLLPCISCLSHSQSFMLPSISPSLCSPMTQPLDSYLSQFVPLIPAHIGYSLASSSFELTSVFLMSFCFSLSPRHFAIGPPAVSVRLLVIPGGSS